MTDISDVRDLLAQAVTSGTGTRCDPYASDNVNAPCFQVDRAPMDPRMVFGGSKSAYVFMLKLYVNREAEIAAQKLTDEHCSMTGDRSLKLAIEDGDNWPSALVDFVELQQVGETVEAVRGDSRYLMTPFTVEVVW